MTIIQSILTKFVNSNHIFNILKIEVKPSGPENLETALKERLEACRKIKATAESDGNSSKARRYGRICKQFEDAIELHSSGKSVPLDDLPIVPGFEPLTVTKESNVSDSTLEMNEKSSESLLPSENKISSIPKTPASLPGDQTGIRGNIIIYIIIHYRYNT